MKKTLLIGLLIIIVSISKSQTKSYNGKFEDGNATYQYYENENMDRVINGMFNYNGSLYDMKGKFLNGNKNGEWNIYAKNKSFNGLRGSIIINTQIIGNYKSGALDGSWTYSNSISFKNDDQVDKETSTVSFINNYFVGNSTYEASWPIKYKVTGQYDDFGFMSGTWIYTRGKEKDEIKFNKGIAYWRLFSDTTNGEKKVFCDSTNFVNKFWLAYDQSTNTSTINGKNYQTDTILISSERVAINKVIKIAGPWDDSRGYNPLSIWQNDNIDVYESGTLSNPLYYFPKGSIKPKAYQIVIIECNRSSDCYKLSEKEIEEIKENQFKEYLVKADWSFNTSTYDNASKQISDKATAIELYKKALEIKEDKYAKQQIISAQNFIKDENRKKELITEAENLLNEFSENKSTLIKNENLLKKKQLFIAYTTSSNYLYDNLHSNNSNIYKCFLSQSFEKISLLELEKYNIEIKNVIEFQNKIASLTNEDTKDLEKKLKKLDTAKAILELLN